MKTYDPALMLPVSLGSQSWALNSARFYAKDIPNSGNVFPLGSLEDSEWLFLLDRSKVVVKDTAQTILATYYMPHKAAISALKANPYWLQREGIQGYSSEYRSLEDVCSGIEQAGESIEREMQNTESLAGRAPSVGGIQLLPAW